MSEMLSGYCGLDCSQCQVYIAAKSNDSELKRRTAEEWSILYREYLFNELTEEDIHCQGCKSQDSVCFVGSRTCPIRNCSSKKQYETCAGCDTFDECDMLQGFFSMNREAKENLIMLRNKSSETLSLS